jgi:hypothetical protein
MTRGRLDVPQSVSPGEPPRGFPHSVRWPATLVIQLLDAHAADLPPNAQSPRAAH